jgi:hypothetical protein
MPAKERPDLESNAARARQCDDGDFIVVSVLVVKLAGHHSLGILFGIIDFPKEAGSALDRLGNVGSSLRPKLVCNPASHYATAHVVEKCSHCC